MPEPKPTESVSSPGVSTVPPPGPPSQPDPNAPPADPSASPSPPEPPKPTFRSLDDDLAELSGEPPKPPEKPKAKPKAPPEEKPPEGEPKAPETPPEGDDDYLGVPPKPKPKEPETPPEEPTGPLKAPELRAEYAKVKARLKEVETELGTLKSGGKPIDEGERKAYVTEIDGLKKQLEEATTAIKSVAYEQSQEYKDKFEKPFVDAWNEGVQLITGLNVQSEDGEVRKGTPEDFTAIMQQPDNEQAATMAQEMFGPNAFYVLAQRRDIIKLHGARVRALDEFRANLSEREKAQIESVQKQQQEVEAQRTQATALFKKFNEEATQKYPQFFAPIDGDDEGNALLEKGYREADLAFSGTEMPPEKRVRLHSAIRNRAAAFRRLVHQLSAKDSEIEALKSELEEIKGSTPGAGQEGREKSEANKRLSADEEIEAAARYDR